MYGHLSSPAKPWSTHQPIIVCASSYSDMICHVIKTGFSLPETSWPSGLHLFLLPPSDSWGNSHFSGVHSWVCLSDWEARVFLEYPHFCWGGRVQWVWVAGGGSYNPCRWSAVQYPNSLFEGTSWFSEENSSCPGCSLFIIDHCPHMGVFCPVKLCCSWNSS